MRVFESVQDYLTELHTNRDLAVVSKAMAAKSRGVSAPAIERMLADNRLTSIRISGTSCVLAKQLIELMEKEEKRRTTVRQLLEKFACEKEFVFYDQVMAPIGLSTRKPPDRKAIGAILGGISEKTYKEKGVLLSVLVHKKTAGKTLPSEGFFMLADSLEIAYDDRDDFVEEQTRLVFECYRAKKTRRL
jgi:hypothetical protein